MQSISPFIVKHYIPFDFSKEALDYKSINNKIINIHQSKQDIPFHNLKLKFLQKDSNRQLVLTYKNKSSKLFKPKKQIQYRKLVNIIGCENVKQKVMMEQMQNQHKENTQRQITLSLGKKHQKNEFSRIDQQIIQITPPKYKTNENIRNKTGRELFNNGNNEQRIFTSSNKYRNHLSRLHSSINNRQDMRRAISSRKIKRSQRHQPQKSPKEFSFKIKGRKAPQAQMIDHLRKSTLDSINNYNQY